MSLAVPDRGTNTSVMHPEKYPLSLQHTQSSALRTFADLTPWGGHEVLYVLFPIPFSQFWNAVNRFLSFFLFSYSGIVNRFLVVWEVAGEQESRM